MNGLFLFFLQFECFGEKNIPSQTNLQEGELGFQWFSISEQRPLPRRSTRRKGSIRDQRIPRRDEKSFEKKNAANK
jgi:hypothetical protein